MKSRRVQVESPLGIEPIDKLGSSKGPNYFLMTLLFLIPVLIFVAGVALFLMGPSSKEIYGYKIGRFSGAPKVYSRENREWAAVSRATQKQIVFHTGDKVKTEKTADIDLGIPKVLDLRLKPSSEMEMLRSKEALHKLRLKLHRGTLLGISGEQFKGHELEIETPVLVAAVRGTAFLIRSDPQGISSVTVLEGMVEVRSRYSKEIVMVKPLEILTVAPKDKGSLKPKRVNYQEWRTAAEVRDLISVSAKEEAEQVDLRKKAGTLFNYVFDEGVFFKPDWGFADREFYKEEETNTIVLRIDYDVYPQGSFSGMYFKTRDLDLSKVHRFSFYLKAHPGKPIPNQVRIEFKDQFSTLRGFTVKSITRDWQLYSFDFNAQKPTPVSEVVFVFENSRVGPLNASGTVYVKDLTIE